MGALEHDPELPQQQRHREFLRDRVVFKEVVPIADPGLRAKIHQTYRLAYLKDVALPRVLDDATFATFTSLILFNNVEVRSFLLRVQVSSLRHLRSIDMPMSGSTVSMHGLLSLNSHSPHTFL